MGNEDRASWGRNFEPVGATSTTLSPPKTPTTWCPSFCKPTPGRQSGLSTFPQRTAAEQQDQNQKQLLHHLQRWKSRQRNAASAAGEGKSALHPPSRLSSFPVLTTTSLQSALKNFPRVLSAFLARKRKPVPCAGIGFEQGVADLEEDADTPTTNQKPKFRMMCLWLAT